MLNHTTLTALVNNDTSISTISTPATTLDIQLCVRSPYYQIIVIFLFIAVVILSVLENIAMWIAFCHNPILQTKANAYIISLSVSDFLTALTLASLEMYYLWTYPYWNVGEIGSDLLNSFWCLSLVTPFVHISVITINRYKAVISSTLHGRSWRKDLLIIAAMWIYSIGIVALMALHFNAAPTHEYQWNVPPEWYYPFIGVHILLPLTLCSILYFLIYKKVRKSKKDLKSFQISNREFKLARTIGKIIIFLYFVWLPVTGIEIVYALWAHTCVIGQVGAVSVWLTCTSGAINPIIFLSKNKKFRQTIFNVLQCRSRDDITSVKSSYADTVPNHVNKIYTHDETFTIEIKT